MTGGGTLDALQTGAPACDFRIGTAGSMHAVPVPAAMFGMTRDEIRLMLFILLALSGGAFVQWWRRSEPASRVETTAVAEPKRGWATPPYVFKNRKELERVKESLEPEQHGQ